MRRCVHSLIVGVLTFSLAIDAARACGHLRRCPGCLPCPAPVLSPAVPAYGWSDVPIAAGSLVMPDACGCVPACGTVLVIADGCEEIACGTPLDVCGTQLVVEARSVAPPPVPATGSVVAAPEPSPAVTLVPIPEPVEPVAPASAIEPTPAPESGDRPTMPTVEAAPRTDDAPVEEPAGEEDSVAVPATKEPAPEAPPAPAAEPERPAEPQPAPPSRPRRRNIFQEADERVEERKAAEAGPTDVVPPADLQAVDAAAGEDDMTPDAGGSDPDAPLQPAEPADEPITEPAAGEPAPAVEPEGEPAAGDQPSADPFGEPEAAAVEPMRRWIDASASFAVVGRLVAVHGDTVEILKVDGRRASVPLARLSDFDRDYVADAAPRLVETGPRPGATAGM